MITSLGTKTIGSLKKNKNERYAITNISIKDISKIIKKLEKLPYKGYVQKRPKQEPTDSYFYLSRHIDKCTKRAHAVNYHVDPVRTKTTGTQHIPISHVCSLDERKSKGIIADKTYCRSVIQTRANQKALSPMELVRRIANQKAFKKVTTKINKNMQLMKQSMRNLQFQIIHSSMSRNILTYSSVVKNP